MLSPGCLIGLKTSVTQDKRPLTCLFSFLLCFSFLFFLFLFFFFFNQWRQHLLPKTLKSKIQEPQWVSLFMSGLNIKYMDCHGPGVTHLLVCNVNKANSTRRWEKHYFGGKESFFSINTTQIHAHMQKHALLLQTNIKGVCVVRLPMCLCFLRHFPRPPDPLHAFRCSNTLPPAPPPPPPSWHFRATREWCLNFSSWEGEDGTECGVVGCGGVPLPVCVSLNVLSPHSLGACACVQVRRC